MSLHPCFRRRWFMQICLGRPSHRSMPCWTWVFFRGCASNGQDSPKASPRAVLSWKNFIEQLKLLVKWMLIERWRAQYAEFNVPACVKIAVWQLCRETQLLWNSHDSWWPELKMFGSMPWSKVVSTHLWNTPLNLYQQDVKGILS